MGNNSKSNFLKRKLDVNKDIWESELNENYFPFINEHIVNNRLVFPGAGYIDAIKQLNFDLGNGDNFEIRNLSFNKMLSKKSNEVNLVQIDYDKISGKFSFSNKIAGEPGEWENCCSGILGGFNGQFFSKPFDPIKSITNSKKTISNDLLYQKLENQGLKYGSFFRTVKKINVFNNESIAEVNFPLINKVNKKFQYTALIDGAFQSALSLLPTHFTNTIFVPQKIEKIQFIRPLENKVFVQIKLKGSFHETLLTDMNIYNAEGKLLIQFDNLLFAAAGGSKNNTLPMDNIYSTSFVKVPFKDNMIEHKDSKNDTVFCKWNSLDPSNISVFENEIKTKDINQNIFENSKNPQTLLLHFDCPGIDTNSYYEIHINFCESLLKILKQTNSDFNFNLFVWITSKSGKTQFHPSAQLISSYLKTLNLEYSFCRFKCVYDNTNSINLKSVLSILNYTSDFENLLFLYDEDELFEEVLDHPEMTQPYFSIPIQTKNAEINYTPGAVTSIEFKSKAIPKLEDDQILVKVKSTFLTDFDIKKIIKRNSDLHSNNSYGKNNIGVEAYGQVIQKGKNVGNLNIKDQVTIISEGTTCAPYVVLTPNFLINWKNTEDQKLENFQISPFISAVYGLSELGNLKKGDNLLIINAGNQVGLACVVLGNMIGAKVYATINNQIEHDYLANQGVNIVNNLNDFFGNNFKEELPKDDSANLIVGNFSHNQKQLIFENIPSGAKIVEYIDSFESESHNINSIFPPLNISYFRIHPEKLPLDFPQTVKQILKKIELWLLKGKLQTIPFKTIFSKFIAKGPRL